MIPGVTLDRGLVPLYGANEGEMTSQGLDHLDQRCAQYYADGLRFAKWRAAFSISGKMVKTEMITLFEKCSKCRILILAFSTNFCPIKADLSGNTV